MIFSSNKQSLLVAICGLLCIVLNRLSAWNKTTGQIRLKGKGKLKWELYFGIGKSQDNKNLTHNLNKKLQIVKKQQFQPANQISHDS